MRAFRKNTIVLLITCAGILGLLNVSIQFAQIIDCFPGVNIGFLLAEEITETESSEKGNESFAEVELFLLKEGHVFHNLLINEAVEVYLHSVDIPINPAFEKITPPPKA